MLGRHSAILSTFIKLTYVIKIFVLSICEWPLEAGFTVQYHRSIGSEVSREAYFGHFVLLVLSLGHVYILSKQATDFPLKAPYL